jgi:hypothetical protein
MRTRRHFQPMLDSMPYRIAPSAVVIISHVVAPTGNLQGLPTMIPDDTNMPENGSSTPVNPANGSSA